VISVLTTYSFCHIHLFKSEKCSEDFTAYADVCFREFGDRVATWTTVNQPNIGIVASYDIAIFPPARCSDPFGATKCTAGDSSVEPYIAAHNTLMAHASVVSLYRRKYQAMQKGVIGISIYSFWSYPWTNSTVDLDATRRCKDFYFGWYDTVPPFCYWECLTCIIRALLRS
uniref:Uncharacterized protein n=2 Tax=Aegilops tauschii subsp. strangulata TaxID=200361 RepID=A0A453FS24_AEGTS